MNQCAIQHSIEARRAIGTERWKSNQKGLNFGILPSHLVALVVFRGGFVSDLKRALTPDGTGATTDTASVLYKSDDVAAKLPSAG